MHDAGHQDGLAVVGAVDEVVVEDGSGADLDLIAECHDRADVRPRGVGSVYDRSRDIAIDPLRVDFAPQLSERNRVTVAFRLILIIPAVIYTVIVAVAAVFAVVVAAFAVLFTGCWPQGLRTFVLNAGRLTLRVSAYGRLLTDTYPTFALSTRFGG